MYLKALFLVLVSKSVLGGMLFERNHVYISVFIMDMASSVLNSRSSERGSLVPQRDLFTIQIYIGDLVG